MTLPLRWLGLLALAPLVAGCADGADPGVSEAPPPESNEAGTDAPEPKRVVTKGALRIEVLEEGDGRTVRSGDWITVHYRGRLAESETVFDDTHKRGVPYSTWLRSGKVIRGWERGIEGLRVGTHAVLHIPARLAYGEMGLASAGIPPGADLVYELEILGTADRPKRR